MAEENKPHDHSNPEPNGPENHDHEHHDHDHPEHDHNDHHDHADHDHDHHEHDHGHNDHDHDDHHDHEHGDHDHPHADHDHEHAQPSNLYEWILSIFHLGKFGHSHIMSGSLYETSARGIWAIKISFVGLMITALMQVIVVYFTSSIALLADTIHNFGDAATAIPLGIAFTLSRRAANRRYTYGYNRAEDLAGVAVVLLILFSAIVAGYESIDRILNPREVLYLGWVAAAAIIGFIGNEAVAVFRIRVGREIGSAALIADGQHARIDGLTSLAVLGGAIGVWLGFPLADPIIGLVITFAILRITWNATKSMWYRMMDATEPENIDIIESTAAKTAGVKAIHNVHARWMGHQLHSSLHIEVDPKLTVQQGHEIAEDVAHALFHALPRLAKIETHVDPWGASQDEFHGKTLHHRQKDDVKSLDVSIAG